jgi:hypothetical protein
MKGFDILGILAVIVFFRDLPGGRITTFLVPLNYLDGFLDGFRLERASESYVNGTVG